MQLLTNDTQVYWCSPISILTSNRPGRRRASSIISIRLVIPISRILFSCSTPSIWGRRGERVGRFEEKENEKTRKWRKSTWLQPHPECTLASSWFTTVSCTPVLPLREPRCRQIASSSSKMMMCRGLYLSSFFWSASASANKPLRG